MDWVASAEFIQKGHKTEIIQVLRDVSILESIQKAKDATNQFLTDIIDANPEPEPQKKQKSEDNSAGELI